MGTVATDIEVYDRPKLPPGGGPADDDRYLEWLRIWCRQANLVALLVGHAPDPHGNGPVDEWRVTGHLFKAFDGPAFCPGGGDAPYRIRLRYMAIRFKLFPRDVQREADAYLDTLIIPDGCHR